MNINLETAAIGRESVEPSTPAMLQLLEHRFGDGLVYLRDEAERGLYDLAVRQGFINLDGYLTPEGRSLVARHRED